MAEPPLLTSDDAQTWFSREVPDPWFSDIQVLVDRDEIMVIGTLPEPTAAEPANSPDDGRAERRELDCITRFRETTREQRVAIAQRAEAKFQRSVAWATACGTSQAPFSHLNVPVMTRLRIDERQVLDTLVAAGAARSRSDALVWCVRQVAETKGDWLEELRNAISAVDTIRSRE